LPFIQNTSPIVVPLNKEDLALLPAGFATRPRGLCGSEREKSTKMKMISLSFLKQAC
jgi:hypothetical protein